MESYAFGSLTGIKNKINPFMTKGFQTDF